MKHSIAKRVTRQVSLLLLVAMTILFVGAYHLVSRVISGEYEKYALTILGIYSDLLVEESEKNQEPIDVAHTDNIIRYGEYICDWYGVDYVYLYVPDPENSSVTYIAAAVADGKVENPPEDHLVGRVVKYELMPEELAVWNGEQFVGRITADNSFGYEISTLIRVEDCFGNRAIAGVDISYESVREQILWEFCLLALFITAVLLGVYFAVYLIVRSRVSRPAQLLSQSMNDFITDGKRTEVKLDESGTDEYDMIANAFNRMTDNIDTYLEDIRTLSREQERQHAELDIAAGIQKGFLPAECFGREDCEIRAMMAPAKDVGGDLYDYLPLDEHHMLLVIADVSGKGMSAAMFMSVTLTLIRQYAKMGLMPDEILRRTNDTLSENNAAMLFVTAFVGIYDSSTKTLTYSSAGHNPPYIVSNEPHVLNGAAGTLLGLFEGETYTNADVQLRPGDTVFLYTDGVNEAVNEGGSFYGTERLEATLRECKASHAENPVIFVRDSVRKFSGDAEQHDDITMLALSVRETTELLLDVDLHELKRIKEAVFSLPLPCAQLLNLHLAAEECFVNICSYAFEGGTPAGEKVRFTLSLSDRIEMRFADGGQKYNPLENVTAPEDYDPDTQIGGLGKLISFSIADDAAYEYRDGKNVLTLTKYFEEENK